jgi:hypothetical protein
MKDAFYGLIVVVLTVAPIMSWLWQGELAYVPGLEGAWVYGSLPVIGNSPSNEFAELADSAVIATSRGACFAGALVALVGMMFGGRLGERRVPVGLVRGVYVVTLGVVCCAAIFLRGRPAPADYAASLPVRATISTQRASSAARSETVAPGLTLHFDCREGQCGVRAGEGCAAYPNYPGFERLLLRRDEERGLWVFDSGPAQLAFRDGDFACVRLFFVDVIGAVRPSWGAFALAFALLLLATLLLSSASQASARDARLPAFAVVFCCAWALYPALPALLTTLS